MSALRKPANWVLLAGGVLYAVFLAPLIAGWELAYAFGIAAIAMVVEGWWAARQWTRRHRGP